MEQPKSLGVGVIGTGWVAGAHIDAFKKIPGCSVIAICSRDKARAQAKAQAHGLVDCAAFEDIGAFLKHPGLDIVSICTVHPNHPAEAIAAANAGKHLVIEKPLALDRANLRKMLAAVKAAGVSSSVCFELRWIGLFKNIKALLARNAIGKVFYGECSYFHGIGPWYGQWSWNIKKSMGGDALLTAGIHALDALLWFIDSPVIEVSAFSNTSPDNPLQYEYDTNTVAILHFANGALGKVAASIECRQPYLFPILLQGDRGTIWTDKLSSVDFPGTPRDSWIQIPAAMPDSGDVNDHPYAGQMEYFVDCIRHGLAPHNDIFSCAHSHEVVFAINEAIATKKVERVKD